MTSADFLAEHKDENCTRHGNPNNTLSLGGVASLTDQSQIYDLLLGNLVKAHERFEVAREKNIHSD